MIIALVLVIAVLGFLCVHFFMGEGGLFRSIASTGESTLSTQTAAQDAKGKDVSNKIAVSAGTLRPDTVAADAELTLLDIDWTGKKEANYPLIITVSDESFPDNDGLSVYHCADGVWELLGTYLIENHSVSFQTDSLSPFAFQVISSRPTPTPAPTPEPTETPEPTATPEPTPEPIDYGLYDQIQPGEFVQVSAMELESSYIIALLDESELEEPAAAETEETEESEDAEETEDSESAEEDEGEAVTFFDAAEHGKTLTAQVLINYDGTKLATVEVEVVQGADGLYTITSPVTEGMLWTVETQEYYSFLVRASLTNNKKYLNIDSDKESIVLDENDGRTRWVYESVTPEGGSAFDTLTYRVDFTDYYIHGFEVVDTVSDEGTPTGSVFTVPVTTEKGEAKRLVLFQSRAAAPLSTDDANENGILIMTNTPEPITGIDATPAPTPTEAPSSYVAPVYYPTPTPAATSTNSNPGQEIVYTDPPSNTTAPVSGTDTEDPEPVSDTDAG